jgi:DNA-binding XRE family transcriptional regulator
MVNNAKQIEEDFKELLEYDDTLSNVACRIIHYRIDNNLTQKQLAKILGVSKSRVSKLEDNNYNFTIAELWDIGKRLGFGVPKISWK